MPHETDRQPMVLAVDDAPETLSLLTDILEEAGITTLVAQSGKNALALLEHVTPDGILMDAVMPGMDGFETCQAIKDNRKLSHIPVIFMTGLTETRHIVHGFSAGGVDYITKPVNPEELTARVLAHLANSRMAQSARKALDIAGTPLVSIRTDGTLVWATPQASDLFRKAVPAGEVFEDYFSLVLAPTLVQLALSKSSKLQLSDGLNTPVTASYVGETGPDEHLIRFTSTVTQSGDTSSSDLERLREKFGLTKREAEVLLWITQGKTNRDVAQILECSPRTVNKHLEQIYAKLSVENRTAAAMQAVQALNQR